MTGTTINPQGPDDKQKVGGTPGVGAPGANGQDGESLIVLAYFMILQAVNTQQQTLYLKAKQLNSNAKKQIQLDNEDANVQYYNVPSMKYKYKAHKHGTEFWEKSWWTRGEYTTYKKIPDKSVQEQINKAQAKNQQQNAIRQGIENKLMILRQNAQVATTRLNTGSNDEIQAVQEGVGIMDMLQQLTIKILGVKFKF